MLFSIDSRWVFRNTDARLWKRGSWGSPQEFMVLTGFASFVVTYSRRSGKTHNSTANTERAVGAARDYYEYMNGWSPGTEHGVDFTRTLRGVTKGLRKRYQTTPMVRVLLLMDDMGSIRKAMDMSNLRDVTYWALSAPQWQGVMRGSECLLQSDDKARKWDPARYDNIGRVIWDDVDLYQNGGFKTHMRWRLHPSKLTPAGKRASRKPF